MKKLLIVDDDPVSQLVMDSNIRKLGYTSVCAANGSVALEALESDKDLQIVLTDWMMPEMDGLELCRRIRRRRRFRYTYVLVVTARNGKQSYVEALDAGADDFVTKPVELDELRARLVVAERLLGLQSEMRQLHGLLSICSYCKRIRESKEKDAWVQIESYVSRRADTSFSHGICPDCEKAHFPE